MKMNPTDNPIVINCKSADLLSLDKIVEFQGKLKKLTEANRNKLINSICLEGFIAPLFLWDDDGEYKVLDGHQRVKTLIWMRQKGWDIPLLPVDYIKAENEKDARGKLLKITSQYGEFDLDELGFWLDDLDDDIAESIRLVNDEMDLAINAGMGETVTIGDDEIPEVIEPITKLGDLWEIGNHRLLCGDSTESDIVKILMDGKKADMCFTDPPYGVNYDGGLQFTKEGVKKGQREKLINDDSEEIYKLAIPILAINTKGPIYTWFAGTKAEAIYSAIKDYGQIHALIIWVKNGGYGALNANYKQKHEPCLYWKPKGTKLNFCGATTETTIWNIDKDMVNKLHPTQKPVALAEKAIRNHSAGLILDLFIGSGSTLIAAEKTNRICYGMEIDPHYCDVTVNRYIAWCNENDRTLSVKLNGEIWNAAG